jgi:hypothetical protein
MWRNASCRGSEFLDFLVANCYLLTTLNHKENTTMNKKGLKVSQKHRKRRVKMKAKVKALRANKKQQA